MNKEFNIFETAEKPKATPKNPPAYAHHLVKDHAKRVIEALLFASDIPLSVPKMRDIVETLHPFKPREIEDMIQDLQQEYLAERRPYRLETIADGYLLRTTEEFRPFVDRLGRDKRGEKLSQAALETLSIIAFKQPITKPQIEAIRGVDSSGIVQSLMDRQLIEIVGQLEVAGRPNLYGVTLRFMQHFGLKSIEELKSHPAFQAQMLFN